MKWRTVSLTSVVPATSLLQAGLSCAVLDDDDILGTYADSLPHLISQARVVAVSTTFIVGKQGLKNIVRAVRQAAPQTPLLLGGQGIPSLALNPLSPENTEIFGQVDAVRYGEAEEVFPGLVKDFRDGKSRLRDLPGVLYRRQGRWEGSQEPVAVDLDAVAIPDGGFRKRWRSTPAAWVMSCVPPRGPWKKAGAAALAAVSAPIICIRLSAASHPSASWPNSRVSRSWAMTRRLLGEPHSTARPSIQPRCRRPWPRAHLGVNGWIYGRLDYLARHPELLDKTVAAGVSNIVFGMESGDPGILKNMGKYYDVVRMVRGTLEARREGLVSTASLIIGFPSEPPEILANTSQVQAEAGFSCLFLHALNVVPFTHLWHLREKWGSR